VDGRTLYAKARVAGVEVALGSVVTLAVEEDEDEEMDGQEALPPLALVQCLFEEDGEKKVQVRGGGDGGGGLEAGGRGQAGGLCRLAQAGCGV
jgi:hypothetical protein